MTVAGVAQRLRISQRQVRRLISQQKIKVFRRDGIGVRIHRSDCDAFLVYGKAFEKLTRPQKEYIREVNCRRT